MDIKMPCVRCGIEVTVAKHPNPRAYYLCRDEAACKQRLKAEAATDVGE